MAVLSRATCMANGAAMFVRWVVERYRQYGAPDESLRQLVRELALHINLSMAHGVVKRAADGVVNDRRPRQCAGPFMGQICTILK